MSYSRRQLYAFGEPLGDSVTRKEGGRVVYGDGGGGGSPSQTQTQISELPDWAKGYAKDTLAKTGALTDISQNPYQAYGGNRIAGFSPLQQQAQQQAANMQTSGATGFGTQLAGAAGLGALGARYDPTQFQADQFGGDSAQQYMSPYMQNVVDIQQREAQRQGDIAGTQLASQATKSGAFGGGRQAIMQAEAARNLAQQKGDIQARGLQSSYEQAQNQFNADQARRMQAQQLAEQSKQYGAGYGMQGLQTALQGAGQLGTLGGQEFAQGMDINKLQNAYGGQQQALQQQGLSQAYQDFQNQQNYPYKQLGFMSDMIRGLPLGQQTTRQVYEPEPGLGSQLLGAGTAAYGLSKFMAEGGITGDANVSNILSKLSDAQLEQAKQSAMEREDINQVNMIVAEQQERAQTRSGISAAAPGQGGIASAASDEMMDRMLPTEASMARGGIVAFAGGGAPDITTMTPAEAKEYAQRLLQRRNATEAFSGAAPETSSSSKTPAGRSYTSGLRGAALKGAGPLALLATQLFGISDQEKQTLAKNDPEYAAELEAEAERERAKSAKTEVAPAPKGGGLADTPEAKQPAVMPPDIGARRERPAAATAGAPTGGRDLMQLYEDTLNRVKKSDKGDPYAAQTKEIGDLLIKQTEDDKAAILENQAKSAKVYDERDKRLVARKVDIAKREDKNLGLAFFVGGMTAFSTPGSFAKAIGKGALVGTEKFASGFEKIQTAKDLLDKAMDDLEDLRLNRSDMSAKEIRLANSNISAAKIKAKELTIAGLKEAGAKTDAKAKTIYDATIRQDAAREASAAADRRADIAANRLDATERSMKELGDIGSGKASYMGKTGAAGVQAYRENRAAALGARYEGPKKAAAYSPGDKKLHESLGEQIAMQVQQGGTDAASVARLNRLRAEKDAIERKYAGAASGSKLPTSVSVGEQTYARPANFTDAQWSEYVQSVGA
jgi:hypothetical protein